MKLFGLAKGTYCDTLWRLRKVSGISLRSCVGLRMNIIREVWDFQLYLHRNYLLLLYIRLKL